MRTTRSLVFLLPLTLMVACEVPANDVRSGTGTTAARDERAQELQALMDAGGFQNHAWTLSVATDGYRDQALWIEGHDLLVEMQLKKGLDTETEVHTVDVRNGTHRWTLTLPGEVDQPPSLSANRAAFVCGSRAVVVNRNTGGRVGKGLYQDLPSWPSARPALTDSTLYVPTYINNSLIAVDASSGFTGWSYRTRALVSAAPVVAGVGAKASLVVATVDGVVVDLPTLSATDAAPRKENWSARTYGGVELSPAASGDLVFFACEDGSIYAFNHLTGTVAWRHLTGERFRGELAAAGDLVFACTQKDLLALDVATGSVRWLVGGLDRFVVRQGDRIVARASDGSFRVRDAKDGKELARFESKLMKNVATNTSGDLLVFGDGNGTLYGLGAERPALPKAEQPQEPGKAEEAKPAEGAAEKTDKAEEKAEKPEDKDAEKGEEKKDEKPEGESEKPADGGQS